MAGEIQKYTENGRFNLRTSLFLSLIAFGLAILPCAASSSDGQDPEMQTSRQLYNKGTKKLQEGKLQEAESFLQSAVSGQNESVQGAALYNLGHVRFKAGLEELKKAPEGKSTSARSQHSLDMGSGALQAIDDALAGEDVRAMVGAYQRGRGARKELKSATEAVKQAMESYGGVLRKWQRASGDFKSTVELNPSDKDAENNADFVDRNIAKLIDIQQMMMQNQAQMEGQREELRQKLKKLKGKIPQELAPPGGGGEDDEEQEGEKPKEPKAGMKEGPSKDGKERQLTPEEAERLLGMLRLDTNRKLPLGMGNTGEKKDVKRRDW